MRPVATHFFQKFLFCRIFPFFSAQHRDLCLSCGAVAQDDHQPEEPDPKPNTNLTSGVKLIPLPGALAENQGGFFRKLFPFSGALFCGYEVELFPWGLSQLKPRNSRFYHNGMCLQTLLAQSGPSPGNPGFPTRNGLSLSRTAPNLLWALS